MPPIRGPPASAVLANNPNPYEREHMAINRVMIDIETEEPLSTNRIAQIGKELAAMVEYTVVQPDDRMVKGTGDYNHWHVHDGNGVVCYPCREASEDGIE